MGELSDRAAGTMANAAGRRDAARRAGLADRTAKRALDVAVSAMLLAVLAIPIAICAVWRCRPASPG